MEVTRKHIFLWCTLPLLFLFSSPSYGEEFHSFYIRHTTTSNLPSAIICTDSLNANSGSQQRSAIQYSLKQKKASTFLFVNKNNNWKLSKSNSDLPIKQEDKNFIDFIMQFSKNKEFQINHTIFPLPITYWTTNEKGKKKLVMPRDWEEIDFTNNIQHFNIIESQSTANNRKFFIFQNNKKIKMFNFIHINKQWYLIEEEIYQ